MSIKVLEISFPEYNVDLQIDYDQLGGMLDRMIAAYLEDGHYVERSIGLIDHPHKTIDEVTDLILQYGTDKYDQNRESIFDQEFSCYQFDIHVSGFELRNQTIKFEKEHLPNTFYGQNIYCFHELAKFDRGYAVRLGLSMIYDQEKLLPAVQYRACEERITRYSKYLFRFKDSDPLGSLKAIIKIR